MTEPRKYRKKPVVIEAVQFDGDNFGEIAAWMMFAHSEVDPAITGHAGPPPYVEIRTLEGVMRGDVGDWIIRGVQGEFYPCKPDIFEVTYEPVARREPSEWTPDLREWVAQQLRPYMSDEDAEKCVAAVEQTVIERGENPNG